MSDHFETLCIKGLKIKCNYRQPPWINNNIKSSLKQIRKLTKIFPKNSLRKSDHIKGLEKSTHYTQKILEAKRLYPSNDHQT